MIGVAESGTLKNIQLNVSAIWISTYSKPIIFRLLRKIFFALYYQIWLAGNKVMRLVWSQRGIISAPRLADWTISEFQVDESRVEIISSTSFFSQVWAVYFSDWFSTGIRSSVAVKVLIASTLQRCTQFL